MTESTRTESTMSTESRPKVSHERHQQGARRIYQQAILKAIESLGDFQMRSSIDAVRRLTQDILEDQSWNEILFLMTFKSVVKSGDVALYPHVSAELSPEYKRQRTDSLLQKLENCMEALPELPLDEPPMNLDIKLDHAKTKVHPAHKDPPKRRSEHEKWKIVPKAVYDKTIIVNPMDTHE
ncbi:hypothetical protein FisN_37Lh017 [Fistulifera solaris]|uniref:Uncharacterized protein n=1 Tax=Fistulifera solaris TaxID=1519565 RepID=A0A1Z5K177_FISSO|nr:hypothetical protein FisN_37Lh017 [Fistulifera solaris]|eukprot:GAX19751.1 hypothetical protein FisN_37Lh017 [Fistulifera solaris]